MKLISMTDFALQRFEILHNAYKEWKSEDHHHAELAYIRKVDSYARFLRQPLTLGMFIPVDENGNVLEEPRMIERSIGFDEKDVFWDVDEVEIYRKAKEKVMFEGWELNSDEKEIVCNYNSYYLDFSDDDTIIFQEVRGDDYDYTECFETIEDLAISQFDFQLTPSALKQIGL